jgi:hypothetical protein
MTIMSGAMASIVLAVSDSVSPFDTLDPTVVMPSVSALSRFSASFERHSRARARFEEQIDDRATAERRNFLDRATATSFMASAVSRISSILAGVEFLDAEQVSAFQRGGGGHSSTSTSSRPSSSSSRTCTLCCRDVGMFRPT